MRKGTRPPDQTQYPGSVRGDRAVLIVDDDPGMREMVGMVLQGAGLSVESAADGGEALVRMRQRRPALVALDLQLPDLTVEAIVEELCARHGGSVPVILMSGSTEVKTVAGRIGAVAALTKPFRPDELLQEVRRALGRGVLGGDDRSRKASWTTE